MSVISWISDCFAESRHIFVALVRSLGAPRVVNAGDLFDVISSELTLGASDHLTRVARVDEQYLAVPVAVPIAVAVLGEEPQAGWDASVEEKFVGQCHDAVHHVRLRP